ncbi:MAG: ABC transporter ATP-binding protein [Dongiaceae bacterium]
MPSGDAMNVERLPGRGAPLLSVTDLKVQFLIGGGFLSRRPPAVLKAVDGVSFDLRPGETLGLVGESGCGKSTLGRAVLRLLGNVEGRVVWLGQDLSRLDDEGMRQRRKEMQIIFQDPLASLNPRMPIGEIIAEPLRTFFPDTPSSEVKARVKAMMANVGLLPNQINRYPHEFSGGQCQRIGIARAMINNPKLIICDEPVSALDVSIQAQIVNLLMDLQRQTGMALIFISHNLSVVRHISHRIMVLYLGRVAEVADREQLYKNPRHPYTQALISAVPIPDPEVERKRRRVVLKGDLPSPLRPPSGCTFRTRCPKATEICARDRPELLAIESGHQVACHHWSE